MTSHFGVNYDAEIYHSKIEPTVDYDGVAMVDAFLNADSIEEVDLDEMADEAAQAVYDAGGADFVGADGEVVGTVSAYPLNGDGNPITQMEEAGTPAAGAELSLRQARDAYTGTVSDRQQLAGSSLSGSMEDLADGTTTLTATILPSGRTKRVQVTVGEGCKQDAGCPISRFTDASPAAWYHDGVHWALEEGVMNGVGNNKFAPDSPTSRAMIVTMLYRMEGEPEAGGVSTFKDVPAGRWYTEAVNWAFANEIVNGYSAEKFGPDNDLTREQLVTILERYAKYKGMDVSKGEEAYLTGFTDADQISDWAVKAFRWAVDAGIIRGVSDTRLSPKTDATRAQVATMLMRYNDLK